MDGSSYTTAMSTFKAFRIEEKDGAFIRQVQNVSFDTLSDNAVTIRVAYSALNYKDALSATGNRGVTKVYPHTPGIDAAGVVTESKDSRFKAGDEVIVTSYDLGMNTPGGFAEYIRVPAEWVVPLPKGLSLREAMMLGTAGLTAAMCLEVLEKNGLTSPVLVTGSSGGVGSIAVALLSKLGYDVVASTGSQESHELLKQLGAKQIIQRGELSQVNDKPMLKPVYGGAVDTVGGDTLVNVVKSLQAGSSVAACGLVGGARLNLTVYPFILRNVNLLGIDSQNYPMAKREALWQKLGGAWKVDLELLTTEIGLEDVDAAIVQILQGKTKGHVLVKVS
jgi:acrylyl-CoA reductase (NADPH)